MFIARNQLISFVLSIYTPTAALTDSAIDYLNHFSPRALALVSRVCRRLRIRRIETRGAGAAVLFAPAARGRSSSCSCCLADTAARNEARLDDEQACPVAKAPSSALQSCHSLRSVEEVRTAMLEKALPNRVWVWVAAPVGGTGGWHQVGT